VRCIIESEYTEVLKVQTLVESAANHIILILFQKISAMQKSLPAAYCKYFNDVLQLGTNFQSIGNLECLPKMGILAIESPTSHQLSSYFRDENITGKFASKHSH